MVRKRSFHFECATGSKLALELHTAGTRSAKNVLGGKNSNILLEIHNIDFDIFPLTTKLQSSSNSTGLERFALTGLEETVKKRFECM